MAQYEVQTVECGGVPFTEYRYDDEKVLITIEFSSEDEGEYQYTQPEFIFADEVYLRDRLQECLENETSPEELHTGVVAGLELVERRSKTGRLTAEPYWLIGVRWGRTMQLKWYYECELVAKRDVISTTEFEF